MDLGRFNFRESLKHQADARKFGSSAPGSRVSSNRRKSSCLVHTPMDDQRQNLIWT